MLCVLEQTLSQDEESNCHVDKDPGEAQELNQVVHEQVTFLQPEIGLGTRNKP